MKRQKSIKKIFKTKNVSMPPQLKKTNIMLKSLNLKMKSKNPKQSK